MPAHPIKPWYRKDRDAWYVTIRGAQVMLARGKANRKLAMEEFNRVVFGRAPDASARVVGAQATVRAVADEWLAVGDSMNKPVTQRNNRVVINEFVRFAGGSAGIRSVDEMLISDWIRGRRLKASTRTSKLAIVKAMINYAIRRGYLDRNPANAIKVGSPVYRRTILTEEQTREFFALLPAYASHHLVDVCRFLYIVGCRPSEAFAIEAAWIDFAAWKVAMPDSKTTRKTGRQRVIYLPESARGVVSRLARAHPSGPIFRTPKGVPWTQSWACKHMREVMAKMGFEGKFTFESFRHQWITDALERGVPIATVAELAGNSPAVIAKHYSKLSDRSAHLSKAAESVRS